MKMALAYGFLAVYFLVVGAEGVLSSGSRDAQCGHHYISGEFERPRLPLGYSLVTTVPPGACRLNVTEVKPSDNYIALKLSNGSYIMNGEFAVSAPGLYDVAGTRFHYTRINNLDAVYAFGPIRYPIDIMILYTQPKPSIRYEYYIESENDDKGTEVSKVITETQTTVPPRHSRRHQTFKLHTNELTYSDGFVNRPDLFYDTSKETEEESNKNNLLGKRIIWKILGFSPCSRACGGGIQIGKYRCVEASYNEPYKEVSSVHCSGPQPISKKKRCGTNPCPPRWRTAMWSKCPTCGPANRTRIVGCVQDHSKGITKVNDQKCPSPKPATIEPCDIQDCGIQSQTNTILVKTGRNYIDSKRLLRTKPQTDTFIDGSIRTTIMATKTNNTLIQDEPAKSYSPAGGWLHSEWSKCVGWCVGGGIQTREVLCADPAGCAPRQSPELKRNCEAKVACEPFEGQWFTGEWSACSSPCNGKQVRGVLCIGGTGRHLKDHACTDDPKPSNEQNCNEVCKPSWFVSDWGQCEGNCDKVSGVQRRTVWCAIDDKVVSSESECTEPKPTAQRTCRLEKCKNIPISDLTLETQRIARNELTAQVSSTEEGSSYKDCDDKLSNCALAVQARLCHYKYYMQNCCSSCLGR